MKQEQLELLIQDLLDGCIDPQDLQALETELASNPEAMSYYIAYTDLENLIQVQAEINAPQQTKVIPIDRIIRRQKRRSLRMAAISAAAIFLIALVAMRLFFVSEKEPILAFKTSVGTQFTLSHNRPNDVPQGMVLEKGSRLQISQGTAELTFASGVKSIVMAPADITLHKDDTLFMNKGTAWFHVPQQATGFTVKTKDLEIIDLGTEFGVLAKHDKHDEVHVFKGKVRVTTTRLRKESAILTANEARRIDPIGKLITISNKHTHFLTKLPQGLPYLHWSFDKVSEEGFAAKGSHPSINQGHAKPRAVSASSLSIKGHHGNGLRFTGKRGQEVITSWKGITGSRPRTMMCWVRIRKDGNVGNFAGLIGWGSRYSGPHKWKLLAIPGSKPNEAFLRISSSDARDGTTNLADGKWHHVACVYTGNSSPDSNPIQLYIDGQLEAIAHAQNRNNKQIDTMTDVPESIPVMFGTDLHHDGLKHMRDIFVGDLDEVFIFEGALNAKAIKTIMETNSYTP